MDILIITTIMEPIINWYSKRLFIPTTECVTKQPSRYHAFCMKELLKKEPQYLIFIDLETNGISTPVLINGKYNYEQLPTIKQLSMLVIEKETYMKKTSLELKDFTEYDFKNKHTPLFYINKILQIIDQYPNSLIIAHNGMAFDFKIIIANIIKYKKNYNMNDLKFYDSMIAAKSAIKAVYSYKNSDLLLHCPIEKYNYINNLIVNVHDAITDCYITATWMHNYRNILNFNQFSSTNSCTKQWSSQFYVYKRKLKN